MRATHPPPTGLPGVRAWHRERPARPPAARPAALLPPPSIRGTRRHLGRLVVLALVIALLLVSLVAHPLGSPVVVELRAGDAAAVVLAALQGAALGVPWALARWRRSLWRGALLLGLATGAALEVVHVAQGWPAAWLAPLAAGAGAAVVAWAVNRRLRARGRGRGVAAALALDHPLLGAAHLALVALWLAASRLGERDGAPALAALGLLAAFGGALVAAVRASRGSGARGGRRWSAMVVAAWVVAGIAPLLVVRPVEGGAVATAAAVVAVVVGSWRPGALADRRLERPALRRALPLLFAHLGAGALSAPFDGARAPAVRLALPAGDPGALLGAAALAALVGYVAAEWRGRREEGERALWRAVATGLVPLALVAEGARAWTSGGASAGRAALLVLALRGGVALYARQRAHVRALVVAGRLQRVAGGPPARAAGYIRRSCHPTPTSCSTRAPSSAPSSAWPTRSSS